MGISEEPSPQLSGVDTSVLLANRDNPFLQLLSGPPLPKLEEGVIQEGGMQLVDSVIPYFQVAKSFQQNMDPINSMDFSKSGDLLVSASDDDQLIIYNCETGCITRSLKSKKYGVNHVRFTHSTNLVIHASTKLDDTIRYLSLHDNKYLRYFQGHSGLVTGLCMSPVNDQFLSVSMDNTLRLWDLRSPNCHGLMNLSGKPLAAICPEGLIFAVLINNESIKLYDMKSFDKGPFSTFRLPMDPSPEEWASLKFSPNGKLLLLTKNGSNRIRILDAYDGKPMFSLEGHQLSKTGPVPEASFTPDSKYVLSGSADGNVHFWNVETGYEIIRLNGGNRMSTQSVQFNPTFMMFASACMDMSFWIPRHPDLE